MLHLSRNYFLENISFEEVFYSDLKSKLMKPFKAKATRGQEPFTDKDNPSTGLFMLNNKGIIFLYFDRNAVKVNKPVEKKEGFFGMFAEEMAVKVAREAIPFGGVAARLLIGAVKSSAKPKADVDVDMEALMTNPNSFAIPYNEIVGAETKSVGGFLLKDDFLILEREREQGKTETYCITGPSVSKDWHKTMFMLRFLYEKKALAEKLLDDHLDLHTKIKEIGETVKSRCGDNANRFKEEFTKEYHQYVSQTMAAKGLSYDSLENSIREKLMYFRTIGPQVNEGIEKYLSGG